MSRRRSRLPSWTLPLLFAATAAIGFVGFMLARLGSDEPVGIFEALHHALIGTLQLFLLSVSPGDMSNWPLRIAGLLAPLMMASATLAAFRSQLSHRWRLWRMRAEPPTHLYLGGGATAAAVFRNHVHGRGSKPRQARHVGLDLAEDNALEDAFLAHPGCFMIRGDATSAERLRRLPIERIANVWITTGDEKRNLEVLERLIEQRRSAGPGIRSRWFVEISSRELTRLAPAIHGGLPGVEIEYFSIERLAARRLMQDFHRDVLPDLARSGRLEQGIHVCLMGSGRLVEALVMQILEQFVVSDEAGRCVRLSWFGPDAQASLSSLRQRLPFIDADHREDAPWGRLLPIARIRATDTPEGDIALQDWIDAQSVDPFTAVFVAGVDEYDTLRGLYRAVALRDAAQARGQPITAIYWNEPARPRAGRGPQVQPFDAVREFHVLAQIMERGESYPGESMDDRAKELHALFAPHETWEQTSQPSRWSSRMAADHLLVKRALLDHPGALLQGEGSAAVRERLARLEHRRFVVERLVEGWVPMPPSGLEAPPSGRSYSAQKQELRLSISLVPFDELGLADQEACRRSIQAIGPLLGP